MADAENRNLPATERRKRKARDDGQVPRSRELAHFAVFAGCGAALVAAAPVALGHLRDWLADGLRFDATLLARPGMMTERLGVLGLSALLPTLGFAFFSGVLAIAAAVYSGGWNFTLQPLHPKLRSLDPVSGFGRIFSAGRLIDTLKACALAALVGTVGALWLRAHLGEFHDALKMSLPVALAHTATSLRDGFTPLAVLLAVFAAADVPLQRHLWASRLKMTAQEVKQEHKDSEGNIEVKGKIKALMRARTRQRMLAAVPKADLVVMNPTHYAVALKYEEAAMAAPKVVAKGADLLALKIRDLARDAAVPVLQAAPLARALYKHCELDQEVPQRLFAAVAQVLAHVYQLRAALAGRAPMPGALPEIAVPPDLDPAVAAAN